MKDIEYIEELDTIEELDEGLDQPANDDALYEHFRIEADLGQVPLRIDKFLTEHMPHTTRARIQAAANAGFIFVGEKPVKSNYKVRPGDVVTLRLHQPKHDTTIYPEDIPLDIVYEDPALMIVNKPAGMPIHPSQNNVQRKLHGQNVFRRDFFRNAYGKRASGR